MRTKTIKSTHMLRLVSLTSVLLMNYLPSVLACEGCKEPSSVAGGSGVGGISASFSWSVVFMLGVVGSLLTGMLFMTIQSCKQLAAAQQNSVAGPVPEPVRPRMTFPGRRLRFPVWRGAKLSPEIS